MNITKSISGKAEVMLEPTQMNISGRSLHRGLNARPSLQQCIHKTRGSRWGDVDETANQALSSIEET